MRHTLARALLVLSSVIAVGCGGPSPDAGGETAGSSGTSGGTSTSDEDSTETTGSPAQPGEFSLLTYNVAGLPQGVSGSNPELNIPMISPLLNDFDLVLVQEDFYYHTELASATAHPHETVPWKQPPDLADLGDGLNRFSQFPMADHDRVAWYACNGNLDCSSDCLATKGWSFARTSFAANEDAPPVEIDVYNLHMEAGGCPEDHVIRLQSAHDLVAEIAARSDGRAVIVAGDFNLRETDPEDVEALSVLLEGPGLTDACTVLACGDVHIDKVLYRSGAGLELEALSWEVAPGFVTPEGEDLSDHDPIAVSFAYTPL